MNKIKSASSTPKINSKKAHKKNALAKALRQNLLRRKETATSAQKS